MNDTIVTAITKAKNRQSLFHFTRAGNLPAIAHFDALLSSSQANRGTSGERRLKPVNVNYNGQSIIVNTHLRIPDSMIDPATTLEQFRACLDRHVFFWPTLKDCQKMMDTYARREPDERFAVLEFDAYALMAGHYSAVRLSKYDSGSSPRYPNLCSYRKSPAMFLPLYRFQLVLNNLVPGKPSEIREVLVEDRVMNVSEYLKAVYVDQVEDVPKRWMVLTRNLEELR